MKDSGSVTECVLGSNTGGWRSESSSDSASTSDDRRSTSLRMVRAVSTSMSAYGPVPSTLSRPSISNNVNSMSRRLDL